MNADVSGRLGISSILRRFLPIITFVGILVLAFKAGWVEFLSLDTLQEHRETLNVWTRERPLEAVAIYMGVYAIATAASLPGGSILTMAGGFLFGIWAAVGAVIVAATIGATMIFLAARTAIGGVFRTRTKGFLARMEKGFRENELSYMFILRLVPLFPFWAVNIAPAFLGVRLRNFLIATAVGIIPAVFIFVSIGAGLGEIFDEGEIPSLVDLLTNPRFILPVVGLTTLSLIPIIYKAVAKRGADAQG